MSDDHATRSAAAEPALTKALSMAPQHAMAHMYLGAVQIFTNRATQGIAECEQALALDRNLAQAHGLIGMAKYFLGRGAETEIHIHEALRLSPTDILAYRWLMWVGVAKSQLSADAEAAAWHLRSIEANRNSHAHFFSCRCPCATRQTGRGGGGSTGWTCPSSDLHRPALSRHHDQ